MTLMHEASGARPERERAVLCHSMRLLRVAGAHWHAAGTPEQVLEKLRYVQQTVPLEHLIRTFAFGGLPYPKLECSFKLFAEKVMPVVHNDPAFMLLGDQRRDADANVNK